MFNRIIGSGLAVILGFLAVAAYAAETQVPGINISIGGGSGSTQETAAAIKIILVLTILSVAPAILICMTSFVRIIVVFAILRQAIGMQETPPNTVLVSLALFLTLFTMMPVITDINTNAFQPFVQDKLTQEQALKVGVKPLREFMVRQTREEDLALMIEISKSEQPKTIDDVSLVQLIPAYMLNELRAAFQIGFVIFLPFLLIDLVVASVLMSLGMMMVPPVMISLPIKILMFVLIDGWSLVVKAVVGSFH
jgi:flagellar biosynthesis protein FliP